MPEDIALLGTVPDVEVARRTGRTLEAVRAARNWASGTPPGNRWLAEEIALGAPPDEVARRLGRSLQSVTQKPH